MAISLAAGEDGLERNRNAHQVPEPSAKPTQTRKPSLTLRPHSHFSTVHLG